MNNYHIYNYKNIQIKNKNDSNIIYSKYNIKIYVIKYIFKYYIIKY